MLVSTLLGWWHIGYFLHCQFRLHGAPRACLVSLLWYSCAFIPALGDQPRPLRLCAQATMTWYSFRRCSHALHSLPTCLVRQRPIQLVCRFLQSRQRMQRKCKEFDSCLSQRVEQLQKRCLSSPKRPFLGLDELRSPYSSSVFRLEFFLVYGSPLSTCAVDPLHGLPSIGADDTIRLYFASTFGPDRDVNQTTEFGLT